MIELESEEWDVPVLCERDYGRKWPVGANGDKTSQITKELVGFKANGRAKGFLSRYQHGLNLVRLLWPNDVQISVEYTHYKTGEKVTIWNNYFLEIFRDLCSGKRVALTGSASSSKTYTSSVYGLLCFLCAPLETTVMVSTTSGSDAERRVWGDIKKLHEAISDVYPVGKLIDYLKVITFDPKRELEGRKDVSGRDIRNGIMLMTIPDGSEGEKAIGKIIGTKNKYIIWILDELPNMMDGVTRPEANLVQGASEKFQLIGIGNANKPTDPHGQMCEPAEGWGSISVNSSRWIGVSNTTVVFCHGERSPNYHEAVDPDIDPEDRRLLPFPYLSNRIGINLIANLEGRGDIERGKKTIGYLRFAIGFWYGDDVPDTILSENMIKETGSDKRDVNWSWKPRKALCGFDTGWASGGDSCELAFGDIGEDVKGTTKLLLDSQTIAVNAAASDRESYRTEVAKQVVAECKKRGVLPEDFWMDTNGDGGLMYAAIAREWGSTDLHGISSLEPPEDKVKYANVVTEYWFTVAEAVYAQSIRGFNIISGYAKDLFARKYESVGRGKVQAETKRDMKKRIKRSPDSGDAVCYLIAGARKRGLPIKRDEVSSSTERNHQRLDDLVLRRQSTDENDELAFASHDGHYESDFE